jgi:hypothetical protein
MTVGTSALYPGLLTDVLFQRLRCLSLFPPCCPNNLHRSKDISSPYEPVLCHALHEGVRSIFGYSGDLLQVRFRSNEFGYSSKDDLTLSIVDQVWLSRLFNLFFNSLVHYIDP